MACHQPAAFPRVALFEESLAGEKPLVGGAHACRAPVGILTALGGLIAIMARSFTYHDRALTQWFLGFLAVDLVAFVGCLVCLGVAWHRHGYEYMPFVGELERSRQEFEAYFHDDPTTAAQEFEARLRRSIIEAADTNTQNNDDRSKYLYWARIGLFAVLTLSALAGVP